MNAFGLSGSASTRLSAKGLALAAPLAARKLPYVLALVLATFGAYIFVRSGFDNGVIGFDFEGTLWDAGTAIRNGRSPYPAPIVSEVEVGNPALYPPLLMVIVAPLTVLPWWVGLTLWTALMGMALAAALYVLDVRDVRCYLLGPGLRPHHQRSYLGQRDIAVGAACRAWVEVARALAPQRCRRRAGDRVQVVPLAAALLAARNQTLSRLWRGGGRRRYGSSGPMGRARVRWTLVLSRSPPRGTRALCSP